MGVWQLYEIKGVGRANATITRKVGKAAKIIETRMEGLTGRSDTEIIARAIVETVAHKEVYPTLCSLREFGATDGEPMEAVIYYLMRPYRQSRKVMVF